MPVDPARVEEIFGEALATADPAVRTDYIEAACGGDAELRARVESLLAAHEAAGSFLNVPGADPDAAATLLFGEQPGTTIGPYKLLAQIGEGGFAIVFMAEQERPVRRRVALKIIKLGMDTRQIVARFEAERQALAMMDHAGIAKVFDAGATESGRPFFVMELVKGVPITQYCDEHKLTIDQRLNLFAQVCAAVQHAHQKGVIHRDIKPSNVLVSTQDERPSAKVIDFGIAKAVQTPLTDKTLFTDFQQLIGTPAYMSPEQAEGSLDIDTRSDVYSLGVLLYELLAGTPPFDPKMLRAKAFGEMQRIIREEEPPTPSTRLSDRHDTLPSIAALRAVEPRKLAAALRGELDWIVMRCLEKNRARRYQTANALASDVMHYLADEPVSACPPSVGYKLKKFASKHRRALATVVTLMSILLVATAFSIWQAVRATKALDETTQANERTKAALAEATEERQMAEAVSNYLMAAFRKPDPEQDGRDVKVVDLLEQAEAELDSEFAGSPHTKGKLLLSIAQTYLSLGVPEKALPVYEKARDVLRSAIGADHKDTITATSELGLAYRIVGRLDEAIPLLEEAFKRSKATVGADDVDTVWCASNLADAYRDAGRVDEAVPIMEHVLKVRREKLGERHHETMLSMSNLAQTYHAAGRWADALPLFEETLKLRQDGSSPDHPATLMSINNLSVAYRTAGRFEEAVKLSEEAHELAKTRLGPDHLQTPMLTANLAAAYADAGQFDKATPLMEEALDARKVKLGPDHPSTLMTMSNLAMIYRRAGEPGKALPLFEQALELSRAKPGPGHPHTIMRMNNLALVYADLKLREQAAPLFEEALKAFRESLGPEHPDTLLTMSNLGDLYREMGRLEDALRLNEEALGQRKSTLGADHPETLTSMGNLAGVYIAQNRLAEAQGVYRELIALKKKQAGSENAEVAALLSKIGERWLEEQKYVEAEPYLREGLTIREKTQPDQWSTFYSKTLLGESLLAQQKYRDAEPLLLAGHDGLKERVQNIPPAARGSLRKAAERLAQLYDAANKPAEAAKWRQLLDQL